MSPLSEGGDRPPGASLLLVALVCYVVDAVGWLAGVRARSAVACAVMGVAAVVFALLPLRGAGASCGSARRVTVAGERRPRWD